jgi:hypothetical protein
LTEHKRIKVLSKGSRGWVVEKLVSPEAMQHALADLFQDCRQYLIVVDRGKMNWDTGEIQSPVVVVTEASPLEHDRLDMRLLKAHKIRSINTYSDGGVLEVLLPSRQWDLLNDSQQARNALRQFDGALKTGIRSRVITLNIAAFLAVLPFGLLVLEYALALIVDPAFDKGRTSTPAVPGPPWLNPVAQLTFYSWPIFLILSLIIFLILRKAGALRIWPELLTAKTLLQTAYRIRVSVPAALTSRNVVGGIAVAVVTAIILHYLPFH